MTRSDSCVGCGGHGCHPGDMNMTPVVCSTTHRTCLDALEKESTKK